MKTSYPLLFADAEAKRFRAELRTLVVQEGYDVPEATLAVLREYQHLMDEPAEEQALRLIVAVVQMHLGQVEEWVKAAALGVIAKPGRYLRPWARDARQKGQRQAELAQLHGQLQRFCLLVEKKRRS